MEEVELINWDPEWTETWPSNQVVTPLDVRLMLRRRGEGTDPLHVFVQEKDWLRALQSKDLRVTETRYEDPVSKTRFDVQGWCEYFETGQSEDMYAWMRADSGPPTFP